MASSVRTRLLRTGLDTLAALGGDRWPGPRTDWRGAVLMMHRVRPAEPGDFRPNAHLEITPDYLDAVLTRLAERDIPVVPIGEARERLARRERFAVLTFDDGYRDNLEHALPVLKRHGAPFTVYVASGMIDGTASAWWMTLEQVLAASPSVKLDARDGSRRFATRSASEKQQAFERIARQMGSMGEHERDACVRGLAVRAGVDISAMLGGEMMSWTQLGALAAEPLAIIGGHTMSHSSLARLGTERALREIVEGLDRIERQLGRRPVHFAYPFGGRHDVSAREIEAVRDLGLATAVTTGRGLLNEADAAAPHAWPRLSLNGHFQSLPVLEVLLSGLPFVPGRSRWLSSLNGRPRNHSTPGGEAAREQSIRECA